jgi:hypothetical protein
LYATLLSPMRARPREMFRSMVSFYSEELLAPRPTPKLEDLPLSAVRDCLFSIVAAILRIWRPFICNLRTCHALVTGTHLSCASGGSCRTGTPIMFPLCELLFIFRSVVMKPWLISCDWLGKEAFRVLIVICGKLTT